MTNSEESPYTKTELLRELRAIERHLYSNQVVNEVRGLSPEERRRFVSARLELTARIGRLNAALMRNIRQDLEARSAELRQGISELERSLERLENSARWVGSLNKVLGILEDVVSLL